MEGLGQALGIGSQGVLLLLALAVLGALLGGAVALPLAAAAYLLHVGVLIVGAVILAGLAAFGGFLG